MTDAELDEQARERLARLLEAGLIASYEGADAGGQHRVSYVDEHGTTQELELDTYALTVFLGGQVHRLPA